MANLPGDLGEVIRFRYPTLRSLSKRIDQLRIDHVEIVVRQRVDVAEF